MGRGDKRGKARKNRAEFEAAVALGPVQQAPKRGRRTQAQIRDDEDPRKPMLTARCRQMGRDATRQNMHDMGAQHLGHPVGMCIDHVLDGRHDKQKELASLWGAFCGYVAAHTAYNTIVLGMSESTKGAAIQMVRERMEADEGHTVDTRDEDTRIRDAKNNRARWDGFLASLPGDMISAIAFARIGGGPALWNDGVGPTDYGRFTVKALEWLAKETEK